MKIVKLFTLITLSCLNLLHGMQQQLSPATELLFDAAQRGDMQLVQQAIAQGGDMHALNVRGNSILFACILHNAWIYEEKSVLMVAHEKMYASLPDGKQFKERFENLTSIINFLLTHGASIDERTTTYLSQIVSALSTEQNIAAAAMHDNYLQIPDYCFLPVLKTAIANLRALQNYLAQWQQGHTGCEPQFAAMNLIETYR